jgi:hypothetical protein
LGSGLGASRALEEHAAAASRSEFRIHDDRRAEIWFEVRYMEFASLVLQRRRRPADAASSMCRTAPRVILPLG